MAQNDDNSQEELSMDPMADEDLLREILLPIVDQPEHLDIDVQEKGKNKTLVINCSDADRGKVIGKGGQSMSALRTIFRSIAYADGRRVFIEVNDPTRK